MVDFKLKKCSNCGDDNPIMHVDYGSKGRTLDMINNPPHYQLPNGMQTIDIVKALLTYEEYIGWCKGTALKYQFRAGKKDKSKEAEDYGKAGFFLKELVSEMEGRGSKLPTYAREYLRRLYLEGHRTICVSEYVVFADEVMLPTLSSEDFPGVPLERKVLIKELLDLD